MNKSNQIKTAGGESIQANRIPSTSGVLSLFFLDCFQTLKPKVIEKGEEEREKKFEASRFLKANFVCMPKSVDLHLAASNLDAL